MCCGTLKMLLLPLLLCLPNTLHLNILNLVIILQLNPTTMAKFLIIVAAILAITCAAPTDKRKVSLRKLFERRMPFPEPIDTPAPSNVSLLTITQRVDNFDPTNLNSWEQRYYMNNEFYVPGSPIFLYLGGEWAITDLRMTTSHMYNIARNLSANLFHLEHRYYGESRPTE